MHSFILGVYKFCPLPAMSENVGQLISMIRYWIRLIRMSNRRLAKKIFLYDYNIKYNNWSNWSKLKRFYNLSIC